MGRWINRDSTSSAWFAFAISPNDSADLPSLARAIYVGVTGNVAIICEDNTSAVTFVAVPAGTILPVRAKRVMATDTTATDLVGLV